MEYRLQYTPAALADLAEAFGRSWTEHPHTTELFMDALLRHIGLLQSFPELGPVVRKRKGIRVLVHWPFVVYYQVHARLKRVDILRIRHGSRRPPRLST